VKTAKNSKLPKLPKNCFEPVGKGGWPLISTCIIMARQIGKEQYCNVIRNNEIVISIIF
jgi:hypothetical protein